MWRNLRPPVRTIAYVLCLIIWSDVTFCRDNYCEFLQTSRIYRQIELMTALEELFFVTVTYLL